MTLGTIVDGWRDAQFGEDPPRAAEGGVASAVWRRGGQIVERRFDRIANAVRKGLREARWPGRLETISQNPLTVIDVGHTPDGIRQSLASLQHIYGKQDWILVAGISFDKKAEEIAAALAPAFDTIVCTAAHHKGGDPAALAATMRRINPQARVEIAETIEQAFSASDALAKSLSGRIYVAGGRFTAIEFAARARGLDARKLSFF